VSVLAIREPKLKPMHRPRTLREIADDLLEYQRVEYIEDDRLTFVTPPGFSHGGIVDAIIKAVHVASATGTTPEDWSVRAGDFQFDRADNEEKFFIPDIAVAHPGTTSNEEFRDNIAMVVEVTSPKSAETVENDYGIKAEQYAEAGVPLYLLVDQEKSRWTLFALATEKPGYQIEAQGDYGSPIELPDPLAFTVATEQWPARGPKD
jgi:Uma2 family endonuclease